MKQKWQHTGFLWYLFRKIEHNFCSRASSIFIKWSVLSFKSQVRVLAEPHGFVGWCWSVCCSPQLGVQYHKCGASASPRERVWLFVGRVNLGTPAGLKLLLCRSLGCYRLPNFLLLYCFYYALFQFHILILMCLIVYLFYRGLWKRTNLKMWLHRNSANIGHQMWKISQDRFDFDNLNGLIF